MTTRLVQEQSSRTSPTLADPLIDSYPWHLALDEIESIVGSGQELALTA